MKKFKLGDKVKFNKIVRKKHLNKGYFEYASFDTIHIEQSILVEQEGFICGKRTLTNGHTHWEDMNDNEYGKVEMARFFTPKDATIVYLVATNLSRNPSKVSVQHLEEYNK